MRKNIGYSALLLVRTVLEILIDVNLSVQSKNYMVVTKHFALDGEQNNIWLALVFITTTSEHF